MARVDGECLETPTFYCPRPSIPARPRAATPVAELGLRSFTCLDPELGAVRAAAILEAEGACCAPVVDDRGALVGVATAEALLRLRAEAEAPEEDRPEVEDAMAPAAITVAPGASVSEVAAAMARAGLARAPVVSADGEVLGVVTAMDLVRWLAAWHD